MKIVFENSYGQTFQIGEATNKKNAWAIINQYLEKINFKSYYKRMSLQDDNTIWIDFGSHTSFFYITHLTDDERNDILK